MLNIILIRKVYKPTKEQLQALTNEELSASQRAELLDAIPYTIPRRGKNDCTALNAYELADCLPVNMENGERLSLEIHENRALLIDYAHPARTAEDLIADYHQQDVCAAEFLADKEVPEGMTFEQAFELYIEVMKTVEGDRFTVTKENETFEL